MNPLSLDISNRVALHLQEAPGDFGLHQRPESVSHWRLRVDGLKTGHLLQIAGISHALLSNRPLPETVCRNENFVVEAFLNSPDAAVLKAVLTEKAGNGRNEADGQASVNEKQMKTEYVFIQLHAANDQIMKAKTELETIWQVRHEGLEEKLIEIRRTYVNWSLQVANMLFVNRLLGKIVKDRFEDTPLNEFKSSPVFNQFAPTVSVLAESVELAGIQDRKLFDAVADLNRLVTFSEWEKAYLLYREVFPTSVNALIAKLDQIISLERRIIEAQAKGIQLFSERIAPASETLMDSLELITRMLLEISENTVLPPDVQIIPLKEGISFFQP